MNSVKRVHAIFIITVFFLLVFLPIVQPLGTVSAQTSSYSISQVDHEVEIMYSGQVVIRDTIHISGQVSDGFKIGFPSKYSADVLKAVAYDDNNSYPVSLGVQLGDQTGFYGVSVNFNGNSPSVFTVAFILSSNVLSYDLSTNYFTLDFPAYPSLTQNAASCNVTVTLPSTPGTMNITKSDGFVNGNNYGIQNLAAYTNSGGSALFDVSFGTLLPIDISQLNRDINIDPSGKLTISDSYQIINNFTYAMTSFILDVPTTASNIVVRDEFGRALSTEVAGTITYGSSDASHDAELINATLVNFLTTGQTTTIIADYNLPGATLQGSQYVLSNFKLFPDFYYYVEHATFTFTPPEGATIVTPKVSSLDSSATLTRGSLQDTLILTRDGISYLDYNIPESNNLQMSYNYNPIWVSFRPTFWLSFLALIGCVAAVVYKKRKPSEKEKTATKIEKLATPNLTSSTSQQIQNAEEISSSKHITTDEIKAFTDSYEEKKQLNTELRSLDSKAQKGKIPRRQYKVQRRTIETRIEAITRNTNALKDAFRRSGSSYADIVKQLDSAEADLTKVDEDIKNLESRQSSGEISLETYKKTIGEYQKNRDKAESTMNGILLRLREKGR